MIDALSRWWDSDVMWNFRHSPVAIVSAVLTLLCFFLAFFAGWVAPFDPFDMATVELADANKPPSWIEGGDKKYWLGTDLQGRDLWSALLHGSRISILVGLASVALSLLIGVSLGLVAGFIGGRLDALIMRIADIQLSFPSILVALLIDGVGKALLPKNQDNLAFGVLILAIALSGWVQYARTVRGSTMVERNREYVQAARVIGVSNFRIMWRHVLPNVLGPVLVLATLQIATAIISEATLSFLGVGVPVTSPSLGTLIRIGNDLLVSNEWWLVAFPALALILIVLSINLFGDWLRDALNPRLQ